MRDGKGNGRKSGAPIILPKARFFTSNSITRVKRSRLGCGAGSLELKFRRRRLGGGRMLSPFVRSSELEAYGITGVRKSFGAAWVVCTVAGYWG